MKKASKCYRCKKEITWDSLIWDLHATAKGYKSQVHNCECGHKQSRHIPVSKEKISDWKKALGIK